MYVYTWSPYKYLPFEKNANHCRRLTGRPNTERLRRMMPKQSYQGFWLTTVSDLHISQPPSASVSQNSPKAHKMTENLLKLKIEFGGGLDLLFSNKRTHQLTLPLQVPNDNSTDLSRITEKEKKAADMEYLIHYLRDHLLKERPELFMENKTV